MIISRYFLYFYIYSFIGWIYETIVMTIWIGKWDNRGFLFEPIIPIYGFGAIALSGILEYCSINNIRYTWKQLFLVSVLGSIVLEYSTGWLLEKVFHAYWWDYSRVPFNVKGRICLFASLGFGVAGLVVAYMLYPFTYDLVDGMSPLYMELVSLILMGILASDTALTVSALINFEQKMVHIEEAVNEHMTSIVEVIREKVHIGNSDSLTDNDKTMLDVIANLMNHMQRDTIGRIKGFRRKKSNKRFNYMLSVIKSKSSKFIRKNE